MYRHNNKYKISEIFSEKGEVERPTDGATWHVRRLTELRGDRLFYSAEIGPIATAPKLADFCALAEASAEKIRDFAARHGVLEICDEHGLPLAHRDSKIAGIDGKCKMCGLYSRPLLPDAFDPIDAWRRFAREFDATLRIADRLLQGKGGMRADWEVLYSNVPPPLLSSLVSQKFNIAAVVNYWFAVGNVRPLMRWTPTERRPIVKLGTGGSGIALSSGLFGNLALQLSIAVGQLQGHAICAHCGREFAPARRPRKDRRAFCPQCQEEGWPHRYAAEDSRERQRRRGK